jgi:hypothetical protein
MRVVGVELVAAAVRVVLVEGDVSSFTVPDREELVLSSDDRPTDYVEVRKRLIERVRQWKPQVVCIEPLEPGAMRRGVRGATIQAAELRGVVAEAARSAGVPVEFHYRASVNANIGVRDADAYVKDDTEWSHLGPGFLKKFRTAALLALSRIRAT